jgi:hypothetical protein
MVVGEPDQVDVAGEDGDALTDLGRVGGRRERDLR